MKHVAGQGEKPLSAADIAQAAADTVAYEAEKLFNAQNKAKDQAKEKINDLERLETPRRIAEAVLTQEGRDWLQSNRNAIEVERQNI